MLRIFDITLSAIALILLFPLFLIISIVIILESRGGIFYTQKRVGKKNIDFSLFKFRTMYINSDTKGLLTIGKEDKRITKIGRIIRKYKIDELPQFINVLKGDMSIVGPRPEVRKYVNLYTPEQRKILSIKPGITDFASIEYVNENELLSLSDNPEKLYVDIIMKEKINLNMKYINNRNIFCYLLIILLTLKKIIK